MGLPRLYASQIEAKHFQFRRTTVNKALCRLGCRVRRQSRMQGEHVLRVQQPAQSRLLISWDTQHRRMEEEWIDVCKMLRLCQKLCKSIDKTIHTHHHNLPLLMVQSIPTLVAVLVGPAQA